MRARKGKGERPSKSVLSTCYLKRKTARAITQFKCEHLASSSHIIDMLASQHRGGKETFISSCGVYAVPTDWPV